MIPADLTAELGSAVGAAVAAGELPGQAAMLTAAGTWRPAPARAGPRLPGRYATSLPLALAARAGADPRAVAALLVPRLRAPWIGAVDITGPGYLTVTVTAAHLAGLPARIVAAGPAAARTDALAGRRLTAPRPPDLTVAPEWPAAWRGQRDALIGVVSLAAGAAVTFIHAERSPARGPAAPAGGGPVAAAVAYYGADAVRYALARAASPSVTAIEAALAARRDLSNPFVAVRYAHASAVSARRWSAGLPAAAAGATAAYQIPELLLLDAMSWLGERVAAAARRRRPADVAAYLEHLASAWLGCDERRLLVADAAGAALAAGLGLLGVSAPARM